MPTAKMPTSKMPTVKMPTAKLPKSLIDVAYPNLIIRGNRLTPAVCN
jgi:hypothetical protein